MPTPSPILEDLPFLLARATLSFRRFNDQTLKAVGLERMPPGFATVLHWLEELGECTIKRLVEKTHLPNGTLTWLLDTLQRDGHIQRTRNPKDGRSWLIGLTEKGNQLCEKLNKRHQLTMDHFRETLSDAESAELTRLLGKATDSMHSYPPNKTDSKIITKTALPY